MKYTKHTTILENRTVWIIEIENDFSKNYTLLLSKVSEAVLPNTVGNHIGEGATMDKFLEKQTGVKFIINGGYNHYRKNFYEWNHDKFNVGDPVGLVKIRDHYFEDVLDIESFGFFVQKDKKLPWEILKYENLNKSDKYILGCTPLLIYNKEKTELNLEKMQPMPPGKVNPPSILGHGLQHHPRTLVGIKENNLFFMLVEGDETLGGATLPEMQQVGLKLGLDSLLNLDGGGSSQFRIFENNNYLSNYVAPEDKNRILGNVIVLFDKNLE